jgi:CRP-like cAMP-binding protein
VTKQIKIIEMTSGDIFGEESMVFGRQSTSSIVVKGSQLSVYVIDPKFFEKKFRLLVPSFIELCKEKYKFFDEIWDKV